MKGKLLKDTAQIVTRRCVHHALLLLVLLSLLLPSVTAQSEQESTGMNAARLVQRKPIDQPVTITLHKVTTNRQGTDVAGPALDLTNPELKFFTGDRVRVMCTAPFDAYLYIVNHSDSGGTTLQYPRSQEDNVSIPANKGTEWLEFELENLDGKSGLITEELVVFVSRTKIESPKLNDLLKNMARFDQKREEYPKPTRQQQEELNRLEAATKLPSPQQPISSFTKPQSIEVSEPSTKKSSPIAKVGQVLGGIACGFVSNWLGPWLGVKCANAVGGGHKAATFKKRGSDNGVSAIAPESADQLYFTLTFQHQVRR